MTPDCEGGYARLRGKTAPMLIYDGVMAYQSKGIASVVVVGKE